MKKTVLWRCVILTLLLALFCAAGVRAAVDAEGEVVGAEAPQAGAGAALAEDAEGLPQLETPYDLVFGIDYHRWYEDEDKTEPCLPVPGMLSWKMGELRQDRCVVRIYRVTGAGDVLVDESANWFVGENGGGVHVDEEYCCSCFRFLLEDRESGDYYFTVRAKGDGVSYADSETAVSETWHFEKPGSRLPTPENTRLQPPKDCSWTNSPDALIAQAYIQYYYAASPEDTPVRVGGIIKGNWQEDSIPDNYIESNGVGYYSATVTLLSWDVTEEDIGRAGEMSEPLYISAQDLALIAAAGDIDADSSMSEKRQALEAVRTIGAENLAAAMAADRDNSGSAGTIAALEETLGNTSVVAVDEEIASVFDPAEVSVIGAGLNVAVGQSVTLKVGAADRDKVIPPMYANTLQFSMHLENEAGEDLTPGSGTLDVPVKVTLPVPENINPQFLSILHHHADGSYEEVFLPYVHEVNGKWYATFVVRSFSDFTLAETGAAAEYSDGLVEVSVRFAVLPDAVNAVCVLYGEEQMLGLRFLTPGAGEQSVSIPCGEAAELSVRIFVLDAAFLPLTEVSRIPVS